MSTFQNLGSLRGTKQTGFAQVSYNFDSRKKPRAGSSTFQNLSSLRGTKQSDFAKDTSRRTGENMSRAGKFPSRKRGRGVYTRMLNLKQHLSRAGSSTIQNLSSLRGTKQSDFAQVSYTFVSLRTTRVGHLSQVWINASRAGKFPSRKRGRGV